MAAFWEKVGDLNWKGALSGGLPALLDQPTEGITPSVVPGSTHEQFTERNKPINAVPGAAASGNGWVMHVAVGTGALVLLVVLLRVAR